MPYGYSQRAWDEAKREALSILQERAQRPAHPTITYSDLVKEIEAIRFGPDQKAFHDMLGEISVEETKRGKGMLSVLVVLKDLQVPGDGFFKLARELNHNVHDKTAFFAQELQRVLTAHAG